MNYWLDQTVAPNFAAGASEKFADELRAKAKTIVWNACEPWSTVLNLWSVDAVGFPAGI